jgi:hypothetical protein
MPKSYAASPFKIILKIYFFSILEQKCILATDPDWIYQKRLFESMISNLHNDKNNNKMPNSRECNLQEELDSLEEIRSLFFNLLFSWNDGINHASKIGDFITNGTLDEKSILAALTNLDKIDNDLTALKQIAIRDSRNDLPEERHAKVNVVIHETEDFYFSYGRLLKFAQSYRKY